MQIDSNMIIPVEETNTDIPCITHISDTEVSASMLEMSDDKKVDFIANRILEKYKQAFEELAK